jgi:hypothetical protein
VSITADDVDNGSSDACGIASLSVVPDSFTCDDLGENTVLLTVTDINSNVATCSATVTITDDQLPVIVSCPDDLIIEGCGTSAVSGYSVSPTYTTYSFFSNSTNNGIATDNCIVAQVLYSDIATGNCPLVVSRTWRLEDSSGNTTTCVQTITVEDIEAPEWNTSAGDLNRTFDCSNTAGIEAAQQLFPVASDNCDPDVTNIVKTSGDYVPGVCPQEGSYTNTWVVTDYCGNTSEVYTQVINVEDNTPPTISGENNSLIILKDENCEYDENLVFVQPDITDNCDPAPTATYTDDIGFVTSGDGGTLNHGQGYYFNFNVYGLDDYNANQIKYVYLEFQANKNIGNIEFTLVSPSGQGVILVGPYCFGCNTGDNGVYMSYFYPNSSGYPQWNSNNYIPSGEGSFTPWGGLTSPNFGLITGLTTYVSSFEELTGPMNGTWFIHARKDGTASGNIEFINAEIVPESCQYDEVIVRTWTATDACNNASLPFEQVIIIKDDTPPTVTAGTIDISYPDITSAEGAAVSATTYYDNCSLLEEMTVSVSTIGTCSATITVTVTDLCNNTTSVTYVTNIGSDPVFADFSADDPAPPKNTTVIFTDLSAGDVTTHTWNFSPATVIFVDGTNENSPSPHVQFVDGGLHTITLIIENDCFSDMKVGQIRAGIHGLWIGTTSMEWNTSSNWDDDLAPNYQTDVLITTATSPTYWPKFVGDLKVGSGTDDQCNSITFEGTGPEMLITIQGALITETGSVINATSGSTRIIFE